MPWRTADNQGPPPCTCPACQQPTDTVTVPTPYGDLTIPRSVYELWDAYGPPSDLTVREMVHNQHKEP